jgi:hypothetical protein
VTTFHTGISSLHGSPVAPVLPPASEPPNQRFAEGRAAVGFEFDDKQSSNVLEPYED